MMVVAEAQKMISLKECCPQGLRIAANNHRKLSIGSVYTSLNAVTREKLEWAASKTALHLLRFQAFVLRCNCARRENGLKTTKTASVPYKQTNVTIVVALS